MATFFRSDGWVKSVLGNAIAGAQIFVCTQPADASFLPPIPLATVFSDPAGLSPVVQPIITDGFGHYDFYAASGIPYSVVVVNQGKLQQIYADQVPMGATIGSGGAVSSVFGRTGSVVAQVGDYASFYDSLGAAAAAVVGLAPLNNPSFTGTIQIVNASITGTLEDGTGVVGTPGQLLSSTGTGTLWTTPAGSGSLFAKTYFTTAQRAIGTVYQNTTGQTILVHGWMVGSNNNMQALTDSASSPTTVVLDQWAASGFGANFMFVVKNNDFYKVTLTSGTPAAWIEQTIITGSVTFSGDLSGSRTLGTVFQNTSGKAMLVLVDLASVGSTTLIQAISDAAASPTDVVVQASGVAAGSFTFWMMVPNNHYYKVTCAGASVGHWNEYTLPFNAVKSIDYAIAPAPRKLQVSGSPSIDGVNINSSGKDLFLSVSDTPSQTGSFITDTGVSITMGLPFDDTTMSNNNGNTSTCEIFVAMGDFYSARQDAGSPTLNHWWEYLLG